MKDWFHAILGHLYKTYPLDHSWHIINDFLESELKIDNVNGNSLHQLSAILYILKEKGYIDGLPQVKNKSELTRTQAIGLYATGYNSRNSLLTHNIEIRLTIDGYVYMQNREIKLAEHESVLRTNISIRENTKNQKLLTQISLLIASVSTLFIVVSACVQYNDTTSEELQDLNNKWKMQLQLLKNIEQYQKEIDSSLSRIREDTFLVKVKR